MATKAARLLGSIRPAGPLAQDPARPWGAPPPTDDDLDRAGALLAQGAAVAVTALLVLGLGALLVAEYALVWQLLFTPWLNSPPAAGW